MMLGHLGHRDAEDAIVAAIETVLKEGPRTRDMGGTANTVEVGKGHRRSALRGASGWCKIEMPIMRGGVMKRREFLALGGGLAAWSAIPAQAAYPEKPVHYIIAFAPGGESDIAARLQQQVWRKKWGQELVVESKPGAGGALAWSQLNSFPGDGYTIMGTNMPHLVLQPLEGNVQYKTDDIVNVIFFNYTPDAIVVRTDSPLKTFKDFVDAAKARPGTLNLAGSGTNSANHAAHARLNQALGISTTYVAFKGTGDLALRRSSGGTSTARCRTRRFAVAQKGKTACLAVATEQRLSYFPTAPPSASSASTGSTADTAARASRNPRRRT
jgi:tripartite-type tricarboxylate transporter receptor subunit TctC